MTTVRELIEHLSKFPPGAIVVHPMYSEVCDLDLEDVIFVPGSKSKLIRWDGDEKFIKGHGNIKRGDPITFYPGYMPEGYAPEFVDAVHFSGN